MIVNRTGAGFHRDNRREVRMPRKAEREWAIAEQIEDPEDPDSRKMESQVSS